MTNIHAVDADLQAMFRTLAMMRDKFNPDDFVTVTDAMKSWGQFVNENGQLTGFDFGATRTIPYLGIKFFIPHWTIESNLFQFTDSGEWTGDDLEYEWLSRGLIFLSESDCQNYCDYLNSRK